MYYLIILSNSYSIGCKTKAVKEAPKQNEDCQFPFQYNGQSYSNCTNIDFGVVFWCSTEANATDNNWGVCEDSCPKEKIGNIIWIISYAEIFPQIILGLEKSNDL